MLNNKLFRYSFLVLVTTFASCSKEEITDVRDSFVGTYRVTDDFYYTNDVSKKRQVNYDLEIVKSGTDDGTAVIVKGLIAGSTCSQIFEANIRGSTALVLKPNQQVRCNTGYLELFGTGFFDKSNNTTLKIDYTIISSGPSIRGLLTGTKL